MKFIFLVEGHTEQKGLPRFFKKWLDPQLRQPVGIKIRNLGGCSQFIREVSQQAQAELARQKINNDLIAVIGLLDLYGPQGFYPSNLIAVEDRYRWGKQYFEKQVNHPGFRMYFAVHEVEAWLLSRPDLFPRDIAKRLSEKAHHPEMVNFDEPPAKLLDNLYYTHLKRHYDKVLNGGDLFQVLDPQEVHHKCPYFGAMMNDLLIMAREAGA